MIPSSLNFELIELNEPFDIQVFLVQIEGKCQYSRSALCQSIKRLCTVCSHWCILHLCTIMMHFYHLSVQGINIAQILFLSICAILWCTGRICLFWWGLFLFLYATMFSLLSNARDKCVLRATVKALILSSDWISQFSLSLLILWITSDSHFLLSLKQTLASWTILQLKWTLPIFAREYTGDACACQTLLLRIYHPEKRLALCSRREIYCCSQQTLSPRIKLGEAKTFSSAEELL